jgi:Ca2+-binding RTX toxin-like protein
MAYRRRAAMIVGAVATAALVLAPAPARAGGPGTVTVVDSRLVIAAAPGVRNFFVISGGPADGDRYIVTDFDEGTIDLTDPACTRHPDGPSESTVVCLVPGLTRIEVSLGDQNDTVNNFTAAPLHALGGDGADSIIMGGAPGTAGRADGGPGDDGISSGGGDDTIIGGPGTDRVTFAGTGPVVASLRAGTAVRPTDTDRLESLENLTGSPYDDTLTGNDQANVIRGGQGQVCDPIFGCPVQSGNDVIDGAGGADTLDGDIGHDDLRGGKGDDHLSGGWGDDRLRGDLGVDTLDGGTGADTCSLDEILRACERVIR